MCQHARTIKICLMNKMRENFVIYSDTNFRLPKNNESIKVIRVESVPLLGGNVSLFQLDRVVDLFCLENKTPLCSMSHTFQANF